jgi:putative glutamine amidotransferase
MGDALVSRLIALPAYPMAAGRVDGWADPAVAIQSMYVESLQRAGAQEAVLGPRHLDHAEAVTMLEHFDGLLLPGGGDVNPSWYGQPAAPETYGVNALRDEFEFALCSAALELSLPLLAICRGTQVLNVALGGSLRQHISDEFPGHGKPGVEGGQNLHAVEIEPSSRLGRALGVTRAQCSCHHHQAIDRLGTGLQVTARHADGIVEAIELDGPAWVTGVQWHPEDTAAVDPNQQALFDAFVSVTRR